jgi:novel protein kinase C delta type
MSEYIFGYLNKVFSLQRHILDVQFFDPLFTKRSAALTPIDDSILSSMDQTPFKDFSYTNPNITE